MLTAFCQYDAGRSDARADRLFDIMGWPCVRTDRPNHATSTRRLENGGGVGALFGN
jgi:hypothetical protein